MSKTHLIIAGTNKAGTTSLFRYLADHPEVAPSHVKELRYFLNGNAQLESYLMHFTGDDRSLVFLEASPQYLDAGIATAQRIHSVLPQAKLLMLLRNPVDRLRSFFDSYKSRKDRLVEDMDFEQFAELAIASDDQEHLSPHLIEFRRELHRGRYADHISTYLRVFKPEQLHICFLDYLQSDAAGLVRQICQFVGVDPAYFDDYEFTVENRTRLYRSSRLQSIAHKINADFESYFNRHRRLKFWVRSLYTQLNESKSATRQLIRLPILENYYKTCNQELGKILDQHYPEIRQPLWLRPPDSSKDS